MTSTPTRIAMLIALCGTAAAHGQWVEFQEEPGRLVAPDHLGADDVEEKDYAWGDVDGDGDIDLVCVRKQPFTSTGKEPNVLFMNENGILTDRTLEYATESDVSGDMGFLTPTNDRDVVLVDVDDDGWLDIVTAPTLTDNQDKHISHPRIYMNLGEIAGVWQGFEYQDARIPQMHATAGPRFCSVAAGDVTGDGHPDLYFGDYDSGGAQIEDYDNRLLINDGNGFFTDETVARLTFEMTESAFGASSVIADMNGDGVADVVKQTSLNQPLHVAITYNDPGNEGEFDGYDVIYDQSPYFVSVGDLNSDGLLDIVITDDSTDRVMLNTGNNAAGQAQFDLFSLEDSGGFGGNSVIADLNNDGHNDIIITDVDVDIAGCSRDTNIYRNLGNLPNVSFQKQGEPIPLNKLLGVHDAAVFDINGDGWLDIVMGRCSTTEVWINQPPSGLLFSYPGGLPGFVTPDQTTDVQVQLQPLGGGTVNSNSVEMLVSVDGGAFSSIPATSLGNDIYEATLPAVGCSVALEFYFAADLNSSEGFTDPPTAPQTLFSAVGATGTTISLFDDIEGSVAAWTVVNDGSISSGTWEQADPNGTLFNSEMASPEDDATQGAANVQAFITENGPPGGGPGDADLDGGPTRLISPVLNVDGTDGIVTYARWFYSDGDTNHTPDFLTVDISNNGGQSWTSIPEHTTGGTGSTWQTVSFRIGDYITPTGNIRVRFTAADQPNDSVTEAGIDNFSLEQFDCPSAPGGCCFGDGTCTNLLAADCAAQGGEALGVGGCADDTDSDGTPDCSDGCPDDPNKSAPGDCGCGVADTDSDSDGTPDCNDGCPSDPNKTAPGDCGCGVADTDSDSDGTPDCDDGCPSDPNKTAPGDCGCGVADTDSDSDGTPDCDDGCPDDPNKTAPGDCGCGVADTDSDSDGTPDCDDGCPSDPNKTAPGDCGCGVADTDSDSDGTPDCDDGCPSDPNKTAPGDCGCGVADTDSDSDGTPDCDDGCPDDPNKTAPGDCGCGVADTDSDSDGTPDCDDGCPDDPNKTAPGDCGCGVADTDSDSDGTPDCDDGCPDDPNKTAPGDCGCGVADTDSDSDGTPDCDDGCPSDPNKTAPGDCGCGVADTDSDSDGTPDCDDGCPDDPNKTAPGDCGCGVADTDSDSDGTPDCDDGCPDDPNKTAPGDCGCGVADTDSDSDGTPDCDDGCPSDPNKSEPGDCGCGVSDVDSDSDGTPDCTDACPGDPNKTEPGDCGCGVPDTDSDDDGTPDCNDGCPNNPDQTEPGDCGCGVPDTDSDNDGTLDCDDGCPFDPDKVDPGECGCGIPDADSDSDGTLDCNDQCPDDPNKTEPGDCGCGVADTDSDSDGAPDCNDGCPDDPDKTAPGACGCGVADTDADSDGVPDCDDGCPDDPNKTEAGDCGCGVPDSDTDSDGTPDCNDGCPDDPDKTDAGECGCGVPDTDSDSDGAPDCNDGCPDDPDKTDAGECGCGVPDTDSDTDGTPDCLDPCPDDDQDTCLTQGCCLADGSCLDLEVEGCATAGGEAQGAATNCLDVTCPEPLGACCFRDGTCGDQTLGECDGSAGAYQGDTTDCVSVTCPQPTGACCHTDGTCTIDTEEACATSDGAYNGHDTGCDTALCEAPCLGDINNDQQVNVLDLIDLIVSWGVCQEGVECPADTNGDLLVDVTDLVNLIVAWGPCL